MKSKNVGFEGFADEHESLYHEDEAILEHNEHDIVKTPVQFSVNQSGGVSPRKRRSQVQNQNNIKVLHLR